MTSESPFILSRFEYESRHLYFLPSSVFKQLENPKPTQLIGTRGTGKTTLLQALTWRERLSNESLIHEIGNKPFADHYIGVYLKLPDTQLQEVDQWLQATPDPQRAMVVGMYIDLLWLELLLDALAEMAVEGCFNATPTQEQTCIGTVLNLLQELYQGQAESFTSTQPRTFKELSSLIRRCRQGLERHAFARMSPVEAMSKFPITQVGEFGRKIASALASFCDETGGEGGEPWHFKVCMDEAEILSDFQMLVMNTMLRLATAPVFHVISFVAPPRLLTQTLRSNLTLSEADRQLIVLDEMTDVSFKELTTGVANVRVRARLGHNNAQFDPRECLGRLNINGLLQSILESSVDPDARRLLGAAEGYRSSGFFGNAIQDGAGEESAAASPPIYQTYLTLQLGLKPPGPGPNWERRNEDSAKFRKRMVAAYLSICRAFGTEVRYASSDMVLQMSDRCIRDFLAFMHEIFTEAALPLDVFLNRKVSVEAQNVGIKRASKNKRSAIAERGVAAPTETGRLIDALAQITQIIQTESGDKQHLRASERGIFDLFLGPADASKYKHLLSLISDAGETGFLRVIEAEQSRWRFRVHKSLAPAYGFSYRGAYYSCRIAPSQVEPLLTVSDTKQFASQVRAIAQNLAGAMPPDSGDEADLFADTPLFEGLE